MSQDKQAVDLERAISNWYFGGEKAPIEPVFNAMQEGIRKNMQLLVGIQTPESMLAMIGDPEKIKIGDTFTSEEEIRIKFQHLIINEEGQYFIPLFTREEELYKGKSTSLISQSFKNLVEAVDFWPDCLGYVLNPWIKNSF